MAGSEPSDKEALSALRIQSWLSKPEAPPREPSRREREGRRRRKRNLIVLVVVLLLVLGFLFFVFSEVDDCLGCGARGPPAIEINPSFYWPSAGSCGTTTAANTYNVTLNPSNTTISTTMFGVIINNATGALAPVTPALTVGSGATLTPKLDACAPPGGGWYAILWSSSGSTVTAYGSGGTNGWTALAQWGVAGALPITVSSGMLFEVISSYDLQYDTLNCVGINGNSVTGSTYL